MSTKSERCKSMSTAGGLFIAALLAVVVWAAPAQAVGTNALVTGEIEKIILNDPTDVYSGGKIIVGGVNVILPRNLLIDLPANRLSLQQIFKQAPTGCLAAGQSGLAKTDTCNATGTGGFATISAVRTAAGDIIAGDVFIEKGREAVAGKITYINYTEGYFRVNGLPNDATTGIMVRLNDPGSRHTIQSGAGCAGGPNCSPDPRFTLDPDNYTNTFTTGYPMCIPSTVSRATQTALSAVGGIAIPAGTIAQAAADGSGDILCPSTNRTPVPEFAIEPPVADSRRFAPIMVGDSVVAEGNLEIIGGVRFVSTHTIQVQKALGTRRVAGQPDYLFLEEVFIEAPGFQNQRARAMWIGFTTLAPTDVDIWSIHRDPVDNAMHELPLASVQGCDNAAGVGTCSQQGLVNAGANIFKIRYDIDFLMATVLGVPGGAKERLNPCSHLLFSRFATSHPGICGGGQSMFASNMGIVSPVPHEIIARTGWKLDQPADSLVTIDINGAAATNGLYLFPLGMNLGGLETAEMNEIDLNQLQSPVIFEGVPWNLDRRLGPSGCLNGTGCETGATDALGRTFALDPFPYSGLDPRSQADFVTALGSGGLPTGSYNDPVMNNSVNPLSNVRNRIFSFVDATLGKANGDATVLPYALGTFPVDPGLQPAGIVPIVPVPLQCVAGGFAPVAQNDTAVTNAGVAVTILVLANDVTPVGVMNFASVTIVSVSTGTAIANLDGSVTFTPNPGFSGTATFTYTVAELAFGGVSNIATVTVTVIGPPVAVGDSAVTNKDVPVLIPVLANDSSPSGILIPSSVSIVTSAVSGTTAINAANGSITYTPSPGFFGNDTFTYTVKDNAVPQQTSNVATVSIIVNNVATAPLAVNDVVSTAPSTTVTISILANDQAFGAGNTLNPASVVLSALTPTTSGTLATAGTGTVDFTPAPGFFGTASFTYTVTDSVPQISNVATVAIVVSAPPVANADAATTLEDTAVIINLTANDTDPDGNMLPSTAAVASGPANGTVINNGTGTVVYTPSLNFNGIDTFTYTVSDALGGVSLPATVTVTVTAVNDTPTAGGLNLFTAEDVALPIILAGTDPDGDVLTYAFPSQLLNGTLTGTPPNMTYTPNLNYNGPAFFTYTVSDGVLTSAPASVAITVSAVNDPPVTVNDTANTTVNTARAISVLANDTDVDGTIAPSTVAIVTSPANGTATVNAVTGVVTYTPNLNFTGVNTFTYTVADNIGAVSAPATVTVNVASVTGTVAVARAQFRFVVPGVAGDWRIEGTGTPGATVTIYTGNTIPGPVVGTAPIAADGRWRFQATGSTVLPGPTNTISVQVNPGGAERLAFPVVVQ